ncbi:MULTISPECIES: hypothetical protein [unclassified Agarivorans]|uniref:hypothetical protein n=1 Tax=unclassified Agarivorans TaxID=2636026 RepID=UPI0026E3B961|nr:MULTISPECIES: hypothetical protein [unclassified Agarivorans]MDO6684502.1 hypothetical protein [Agarivorans sp. 3_MG-2023]MDO6714667.1 hypothetical protein [Agarivorans sp. 2_MG-2023]
MRKILGLLLFVVMGSANAGVLHYDEALDGHFNRQQLSTLQLGQGINVVTGTFATSAITKLDAEYDAYLEFIGYGRLRPEGFDYSSLAYDDGDIFDVLFELESNYKISSINFSILGQEALVEGGHNSLVVQYTFDDLNSEIYGPRDRTHSGLDLGASDQRLFRFQATGRSADIFPGWEEYVGQERLSYQLSLNVVKVTEPVSAALFGLCMLGIASKRKKFTVTSLIKA